MNKRNPPQAARRPGAAAMSSKRVRLVAGHTLCPVRPASGKTVHDAPRIASQARPSASGKPADSPSDAGDETCA